MVRTKKIKNNLYYLLLVLIAASCGTKNYGSIYYAGKTQVTVESIEANEYSYLNKLLVTNDVEDSIQYHVMPVPEPTKEELALNDALADLLRTQNSKEKVNSSFGEDVPVEPLFFRDTVQEVIRESSDFKAKSAENLINQDINPVTVQDTFLATNWNSEPVVMRDTVRSTVYDSVRVNQVDTINQIFSVTTYDTIRKTVVIETQNAPRNESKPAFKSQNQPKETVPDNRDRKSTTVIPIIIPTAKKEKKDTTITVVTLVDSTKQKNDTLVEPIDANLFADSIQLVDSNVVLDSTQSNLKDSAIKTLAEIKITELQNKIDQLEQKIYVDNSIILAKLDDLMRMNSKENAIEQKAIPVPLKPVVKEEKVSNKKLTFYYIIAKTLPENESTLIDEIVAFANQHSKYKISLSGYTDASGSAANNLKLSKERVTKIRQQLIARGLNEKNIFIQYFGEKFAVAKNPDSQRRVECLIEVIP